MSLPYWIKEIQVATQYVGAAAALLATIWYVREFAEAKAGRLKPAIKIALSLLALGECVWFAITLQSAL